MNEPPSSGVRASGNWLFFVREFVKMKKIVREFVKTMSFVIREKEKYRSWIREIWNICSWIREFRYIRDSWFDKITFVKSWNPHFLHLTNRYRTNQSRWEQNKNINHPDYEASATLYDTLMGPFPSKMCPFRCNKCPFLSQMCPFGPRAAEGPIRYPLYVCHVCHSPPALTTPTIFLIFGMKVGDH